MLNSVWQKFHLRIPMFRPLLQKHYSYQLVRDISVIFSCHAFTNGRLHQSRQRRQHVDWWVHLERNFHLIKNNKLYFLLYVIERIRKSLQLAHDKVNSLETFAVFHPSIARPIAQLHMTAVIHPVPDTTHNSRESAVYEDSVLLCWHPFCTNPLFLPSFFTQINLF